MEEPLQKLHCFIVKQVYRIPTWSEFFFQPHAIRHRLHTYTKFLFVRHPVERVLSAFRNKFEKNYTSSAYFKKRFGVKIMKKYRKGIDSAQIPVNGHGVKFSEFVAYLADTKTDHLNEHWAPVSTMCYPCSVRWVYSEIFILLHYLIKHEISRN